GDHQDPYGGRQGLAQLLELQVDGSELVAPLPGPAAVGVAGGIEVGVVEVDDGGDLGERGEGAGDLVGGVVDADVGHPAEPDAGQTGPGEGRLVDDRGVHARPLEAGEGGRVRLPLLGVDPLVPHQ